jgi:hypothetical protein
MKRNILCAALFCAAFFLSCDSSVPDREEPPGGDSSLVGTVWWWPSLQLFFISSDRVMLYSTGGYYQNSTFAYTCPAPGYAYSYTYNPAARTGRIADLGEYSGGDLGGFTVSADKQSLDFANYKSYGHGANFVTLRPAPAAAYRFDSLPSGLANTVWLGTIPGTSLGGFSGNPVIIHFTDGAQVYVTRTYDVDTDAKKRRLFGFSVSGPAGTINDIGGFAIDAAANAITFNNFPGAGKTVFNRIQ